MSLNSQIADLILEKGRAQAQGAIGSGQAWSGALSQIGQNLGQSIASIPKIQEQAAKTAEEQRARAARDEFAAALKDIPPVEQEGVKLFNVNGIGDRMNAKGYGPEFLPAAQHLDGINAAKLQFRQAQHNVVKQGAAAVAASGNDPTLANHFLDTLDDVYPPEKVQQFRDFIAADPANVAKLTSFLAGPQKPVVLKEGDKGFNPITNQPIPGMEVAPKPQLPTKASLASAAHPDDPAGALAALTPPVIPRPIEEQLLEAIAKGDTPKADQIKQTLKTAAEARRDPAAQALAAELGGLRKEEAQARLDAIAKKAEPLDVSADVQTTGAGRKYIDLSSYSTAERDKARESANASGAVSVSKEQANALQEIDNARLNQKSIMDQVGDLLPKDPTGRVLSAPGITLSKLFQTDEQKAAYNSWRTAAIQTLRATAGSKGLRINQAEIAQAIENDIPKLTDTVGVARQKVSNINTMLENAEKSILVRDRTATPEPEKPPTEPTAKLQSGKTQRVVQGGVTYEVTTDPTGKVINSKAVK